MQLISVNVGHKQTQTKGNDLETTGVYKVPAAGAVEIGSLGIEGDFICDQENHGGPDQAVYVYGSSDYEWWRGELGKEIDAGTFGENLTISGLESATLSIGDRLQVGAVLLDRPKPARLKRNARARLEPVDWVPVDLVQADLDRRARAVELVADHAFQVLAALGLEIGVAADRKAQRIWA